MPSTQAVRKTLSPIHPFDFPFAKKLSSDCRPAQLLDLCSMLESYDFDDLFLFLDPVINQIVPMDQF